jgi:hypothetical protein
MRRRLSRVVFAVAAVAVVAIAGGVTYAVADIGGGGVISGCYKENNGRLRLIDPATDSCRRNETPISWSQTGPQGPAGATGATGPTFLTGRTLGVVGNAISWAHRLGSSQQLSRLGKCTEPAGSDAVSELCDDGDKVTFIPTGTVGDTVMNIYLNVNGVLSGLACHVATSAGCSDTGSVAIPPNSRLAIVVANCCDDSPGDLLATVELRQLW